jgi:hypothetical protein
VRFAHGYYCFYCISLNTDIELACCLPAVFPHNLKKIFVKTFYPQTCGARKLTISQNTQQWRMLWSVDRIGRLPEGLFFLLFAFLKIIVVVAFRQLFIVDIFVQKFIQFLDVHIGLDLSELINNNVKALKIFVNFRFGFTGRFFFTRLRPGPI